MASEFCDETLAAQIRFILKRKRVSMKAVAEKMDVSYRTVQNYVNGENRIPADFLLRLAHMLNVDPGYFIYGDFRPDYNALRDAVISALKLAGLIQDIDHRSEPLDLDQFHQTVLIVTSEIASKYDFFRKEEAFGTTVSSLPFGKRELKRP